MPGSPRLPPCRAWLLDHPAEFPTLPNHPQAAAIQAGYLELELFASGMRALLRKVLELGPFEVRRQTPTPC